jgi:signal transduction histidine kinase
MIKQGVRILIMSAVISIFTALLLFFAFRRFFVGPIRGVVDAIKTYAQAPEDSRRIIVPSAGVTELRDAEEALASMQSQLTGALRQKERLAQLGGAMARVNHDLRNILTTAQLFTDRMEQSADPAVRRTVPKLLNSISRAVNLCETTLAFGKAEEAPPMLTRFPLASIVADVVESELLAAGDHDLTFSTDVPGPIMIRADAEQLYRVIGNLVRNARQAIVASGKSGEIRIAATETDGEWDIVISDTGPGLPPRAREHLFQPFQGGVRKDGFGLGLAIAAELVRGHGGRLDLTNTGPEGTTFAIRLPKTLAQLDAAAE